MDMCWDQAYAQLLQRLDWRYLLLITGQHLTRLVQSS